MERKDIALEGPLTSMAKSSKLPGTRVSTIARHFDRLTREAERDRQKRLHQARGRRARPVGVTNAKIQVFSNVRDAFRDESDSASSEADDEDDDEIDNDLDGIPGKVEVSSSDLPATSPSANVRLDSEETSKLKTEPMDKVPQPAVDTTSPPLDIPSALFPLPASASTSSASAFQPEQSSVSASEIPTDVSFRDRLQITLPPFDTSAPLLSVPPTPLLTGTVETKVPPNHPSLLSESEGGSVGHERSSILKTLSNLWAFRTGEGTPLDYPLLGSQSFSLPSC